MGDGRAAGIIEHVHSSCMYSEHASDSHCAITFGIGLSAIGSNPDGWLADWRPVYLHTNNTTHGKATKTKENLNWPRDRRLGDINPEKGTASSVAIVPHIRCHTTCSTLASLQLAGHQSDVCGGGSCVKWIVVEDGKGALSPYAFSTGQPGIPRPLPQIHARPALTLQKKLLGPPLRPGVALSEQKPGWRRRSGGSLALSRVLSRCSVLCSGLVCSSLARSVCSLALLSYSCSIAKRLGYS